MKRRLTILMLMAATCCCVVFGQIKRYDADFTLSQKKFTVTVPIEIERNQLFVRVDIGGREYRFKLDTGASQGVIYDDVSIEGLRTLGFIKSEDATGQSQQVKTVELPPFTLGGLTITGFKVQQMKRPIVRKGEDGIIGFALFHKGIAARIDTREQTMTLTDLKSLYKHAEGEVLKYTLKWHVPHVTVSPFEGSEERILFDTGSPMTYAINAESLERMAATNPLVTEQIEGTKYGSHVVGHFGVEREDTITLLNLDRLKWGNFELREVHCITVQGDSHIGAPLLMHGVMIINPFRKCLVFQPYDTQ